MFQQRELKFRAWHPDWQEMVTCSPYLSFEKREFFPFIVEIGFADYPQDDRWVLMQYIGRKDRNGVEIYEGDILQFVGTMKTEPFLMSWDAEWCCYTNYSPRDRVEVIGNIFQHPELLSPAVVAPC